MRLINTETLLLHEFIADIPKYAILSHRWQQDGEATLQQFRISLLDSLPEDFKQRFPGSSTSNRGVRKVLDFCEKAKEYGFGWAWCDTVCVDKTNNVELSEAINSMYRWYEQAAMCIVYLQDVEASSLREMLPQSDWFTRGWTSTLR